MTHYSLAYGFNEKDPRTGYLASEPDLPTGVRDTALGYLVKQGATILTSSLDVERSTHQTDIKLIDNNPGAANAKLQLAVDLIRDCLTQHNDTFDLYPPILVEDGKSVVEQAIAYCDGMLSSKL